MTPTQFKQITEWQEETFGKLPPMAYVNKIYEELKELCFDLGSEHPERRLEWADCFILLFGGAKADGMTYEDIMSAVAEKMEINRNRKWGKPDENGVVNHVKEKSSANKRS